MLVIFPMLPGWAPVLGGDKTLGKGHQELGAGTAEVGSHPRAQHLESLAAIRPLFGEVGPHTTEETWQQLGARLAGNGQWGAVLLWVADMGISDEKVTGLLAVLAVSSLA